MADEKQVPTRQTLSELIAAEKAPCISLYMPTNRRLPESRQDPVQFKNLLKQLEEKLKGAASGPDVQKMLSPYQALADDPLWWNNSLDGIVIFSCPGTFRILEMPHTVAELVVVADNFHTKPVRKFLQSTDRYQILCLSLDEIKLFTGSRNFVEQINAGPEVPLTISEALGADIEAEHPEPKSYAISRRGQTIMNSGTGGGRDEREIDQERFFRAVDRAVFEHVSKRSRLPLILAALPEHHSHFHELSQNSYLIGRGIKTNPKAITTEELKKLAWEIMEPEYHAHLDKLKDIFLAARPRNQGSEKLEDVAAAAVERKVATLLLESDRIIPGRIDAFTGAVYPASADTDADDVLDDLGALVVRNGGEVYLIPKEHMPVETGLAAMYRY